MPSKRQDRFRNMAIGLSVAAALASIIHVTATFAQTDTSSTDGVASASDRVESPVAVPLSPILPDRPMAITGELPVWQALPNTTAQTPENIPLRQESKDARK